MQAFRGVNLIAPADVVVQLFLQFFLAQGGDLADQFRVCRDLWFGLDAVLFNSIPAGPHLQPVVVRVEGHCSSMVGFGWPAWEANLIGGGVRVLTVVSASSGAAHLESFLF